MAVKYAYNTLVYAGEDIERGIRRLAGFGYDGVEFVGEPERMDAGRIRELLDENGIAASSICAIYTPERDLVSSNPEVRKNAVKYLKSCVDFASKIGAQGISVTPTANMKIHAEADAATEWKWAIESLREAGSYAGEHGIRLAVEAWNRYENYLINRLEQSLALVTDVGLPNVGCMGDTYHMNIEEVSIADAFRSVGDKLFYVHFADSNRAAPGRGHIDFKPIAQALTEIGYSGYISMELLPPFADPFGGVRMEEFYDQYSKESIEYLKALFASI
ncbi:sugar phosphate isomerase/epimerase family protein [Cohnella thermotolerans]|jgi:sugar phosphate isomerase/epimerase|uniref:sugar phosphate isomerase/epimerase family protein n=1 Tax=Cohnella thermotolerans TaxID=329858 RepID=UPI000427C6F4|nr:sugar phosphate isomerase/epimerase family protein [Cohnella thermotolerans]